MRKRRALILKTPKKVDFLSIAFAPMPLAPDLPNTRRVRMTRRPPVSECRDETTCLRSIVLTGHKVLPDPTRQKARHSKCNCSEHLNRRQPTRNVRRTYATESHCCRRTKSATIGTPLTPWRAENDGATYTCQSTYLTLHERDCFKPGHEHAIGTIGEVW